MLEPAHLDLVDTIGSRSDHNAAARPVTPFASAWSKSVDRSIEPGDVTRINPTDTAGRVLRLALTASTMPSRPPEFFMLSPGNLG